MQIKHCLFLSEILSLATCRPIQTVQGNIQSLRIKFRLCEKNVRINTLILFLFFLLLSVSGDQADMLSGPAPKSSSSRYPSGPVQSSGSHSLNSLPHPSGSVQSSGSYDSSSLHHPSGPVQISGSHSSNSLPHPSGPFQSSGSYDSSSLHHPFGPVQSSGSHSSSSLRQLPVENCNLEGLPSYKQATHQGLNSQPPFEQQNNDTMDPIQSSNLTKDFSVLELYY